MLDAPHGLMIQPKVVSYRDLEVWQVSMNLVDEVIQALGELPRAEFDLRRQIFRSATSIPSNVAEGYRRRNRRGAYQNHVSIALGSQAELETQIEIGRRNKYMSAPTCARLLSLTDRVGAMLFRLHDSLA